MNKEVKIQDVTMQSDYLRDRQLIKMNMSLLDRFKFLVYGTRVTMSVENRKLK